MEFANIYEILQNTAAHHRESPAYYEKSIEQWQETTWGQLQQAVDQFALALLHLGLARDDTVAVLASNNLLWPISDLGIIAAGGITVGLYPSSSPEQCVYILNHAQVRFIVVDTPQQVQKIVAIADQVATLKGIICRCEPVGAGQFAWQELLQLGEGQRREHWQRYQQIAHSRSSEDIAMIVYTSGTTGFPKGACLSHRYVIASCEAMSDLRKRTEIALGQPQPKVSVTISFMPFCHVAERVCGMYARLYFGSSAYLVDDASKLYQTLHEANPHGFGSVPRFFEKIYAKIMHEVETGQGYDKQEFHNAIAASKEAAQYRDRGEAVPVELQQRLASFEKIYSKVRAHFGNRISTCRAGAAAIPTEVLDLFEYGGNIPIVEAYGLTELVCCAFGVPGDHKRGSVGRAMHGCEIKIASDGEILLKGPLLFSGYYKDPEATAKAIDADGWLHTGDIGKLDEDGFLYITGRKKEFINTSTGKKISPVAIENLCKQNHLISHVLVYGEGKSYLVALVTLNQLELEGSARANRIAYEDYCELTRHPQIEEVVAEIIAVVNAKVSRTEQIKKYAILPREFALEENELTPTGKLRRAVITEKFYEEIMGLYD